VTWARKLPRQVDHSKVETLALARTSAGVSLNLSRFFTPLSLAANIQAILDTSGLDNAIENPVLKL
jgi:hypothetical protein